MIAAAISEFVPVMGQVFFLSKKGPSCLQNSEEQCSGQCRRRGKRTGECHGAAGDPRCPGFVWVFFSVCLLLCFPDALARGSVLLGCGVSGLTAGLSARPFAAVWLLHLSPAFPGWVGGLLWRVFLLTRLSLGVELPLPISASSGVVFPIDVVTLVPRGRAVGQVVMALACCLFLLLAPPLVPDRGGEWRFLL